jgi:predicted nuclease with TOPRIM domain
MDQFVFLVGSGLLLLFSGILTALYFQRMRKVIEEYAEAKGIVGDIIVSFNKQMQRQEEQVDKLRYKVKILSKRSEDMTTKLESVHNEITKIAMFSEVAKSEKKLNQDIYDLKKRIDVIAKTQEEIQKQAFEMPEAKIETAIPIKRERALAPLTETELRVLEIISEAREKTAPEIKNLIKLTREHTARLVKKLYEEGYLERNTVKTPYAYRVKEEMLRFLKKPAAETTT